MPIEGNIMKKLVTYINRCEDCLYCHPELVMHEKTKWFCELTGEDLTKIDEIPDSCPLETSQKTT